MSTVFSISGDWRFIVSDDAGHSQTLALQEVAATLEVPPADGHAEVVIETNNQMTGSRKGARMYGKLTVSGVLADPGAPFQTLAGGRTSGFVSTMADIGDTPAVDWAATHNYGAQVRSFYGQDAVCGPIQISVDTPAKISFTFELRGPMYSTDSTNGIITLVSAR